MSLHIIAVDWPGITAERAEYSAADEHWPDRYLSPAAGASIARRDEQGQSCSQASEAVRPCSMRMIIVPITSSTNGRRKLCDD